MRRLTILSISSKFSTSDVSFGTPKSDESLTSEEEDRTVVVPPVGLLSPLLLLSPLSFSSTTDDGLSSRTGSMYVPVADDDMASDEGFRGVMATGGSVRAALASKSYRDTSTLEKSYGRQGRGN